MTNEIATMLTEETEEEFKKHAALFAGQISNAAEYVFYKAVREERLKRFGAIDAKIEIARLTALVQINLKRRKGGVNANKN